MMRNIIVPYSNITGFNKTERGYELYFKDNDMILQQVVRFFKPFVKHNLNNGNFFISHIHSSGDIAALFEALEKKIQR